MKGFWACPVGNYNATQAFTDTAIANALAAKCDTLIWFAGAGMANYQSAILPMADEVTEEFDPMAYALSAAHAAGLLFFAWFCPGLVASSSAWRLIYGASHPDWNVLGVHPTGGANWTCFNTAGMQTHLAAIVTEMVTTYAIDGLVHDYIRYDVQGDATDPFNWPDHFTPAGVTTALQMMNAAARAVRPGLTITAAVLAGWGADDRGLQAWQTTWMADHSTSTGLSSFWPMAYVSTFTEFGKTSEQLFDLYMAEWDATAHPEKVFPVLAFQNYGDSSIKTVPAFSAQRRYVRDHGYGINSISYFDSNNSATFLTWLGLTATPVYKSDTNLKGLWPLDEASGIRYDSTPNGNHLQDYNTVLRNTSDKREGVASADFESGNVEYLAITHAAQTGLAITGAISFGAWVKPESLVDGYGHVVMGKYLGTGNQRGYIMYLILSSGNYYTRCSLSNNGTTVVTALGATILRVAVWQHVCAVYNGTDIRVYVNGALDVNGSSNPKTHSAGIYANTSEFRLGRNPDGDNAYDGLMDEPFVLNRALSAAEVASIYENGIMLSGQPSSRRWASFPAARLTRAGGRVVSKVW